MKTLRFLWGKSWPAAGLLLLALLVWGSWNEPSLHEFTPTTEFITLDAPALLHPGPAAARLQARARALPGVTACAVRPEKHLLTLAYHPGELRAEELCRQLALRPLPLAAPDPSVRQCPVPPGYITALEKLRFAFNLRRFFVRL